MFLKGSPEKKSLFFKESCIAFFAVFFLLGATLGQAVEKPIKWDAPFNVCWKITGDQKTIKAVASDNNHLIVLTHNNEIESLEPLTGKKLWSSNMGQGNASKLIISGEDLIFSFLQPIENNSSDNAVKLTIRSLSLDTGITKFQKSLDLSSAPLFLYDISGLVIADKGGTVTLFSRNLETILRSTKITTNFGIISINKANDSNRLSILTEHEIISLSLADGKAISTAYIKQDNIDILRPHKENFILGTKTGEIYSFIGNPHQKKWGYKVGGRISDLIVTDEGILVSSMDNFLYLLDERSGDIRWRRRIAGRIVFQPLISDGYAIVLNSSDGIALIIDIKSGKFINQIRITNGNYFLSEPSFSKGLLFFNSSAGFFAFSGETCKEKPE